MNLMSLVTNRANAAKLKAAALKAAETKCAVVKRYGDILGDLKAAGGVMPRARDTWPEIPRVLDHPAGSDLFDIPQHLASELGLRESDRGDRPGWHLAKLMARVSLRALGIDKALSLIEDVRALKNAEENNLVEIKPGTPEWGAWIKHHQGTQAEARMLGCLVGPRPRRRYYASSLFPPEAPRPDRLMRPADTPAPIDFGPRRSIGDGEIAKIADRLEAKAARDQAGVAEERKRRKLIRNEERQQECLLERARGNRPLDAQGVRDRAVVQVLDPDEVESLLNLGAGTLMKVPNKSAPRRDRVVSTRDNRFLQMVTQWRDDRADAWKLAGLEIERLYRCMEVGKLRGHDPSVDSVDGGPLNPNDDKRIDAVDQLREIASKLGEDKMRVVRRVVVENWGLVDLVEEHCSSDSKKARENAQIYLSQLLRKALDEAAEVLGLAGPAKASCGSIKARVVMGR
jgi:hypothetical protein